MSAVKVQVALAIDGDGKWWAYGYHNATTADAQSVVVDMACDSNDVPAWKWLEAEVAVPQEQTVAAEVVDE